jgi:O-acetylserine/cysteine efflux transporter
MARVQKTGRVAAGSLVLAAALWGVAETGTKYALRGFDPITLLAVELLAATVALWTVVVLRGYRPPPSWRRAALLGLFEPALAYIGDTLGLSRTSASDGAMIAGMESVFVVILAAIFLGERLNRLIGAAIVAATVGFLVLEGSGPLSGPGLGDLLVLAGTASAAVYSILARAGADDEDPLTVTAHQFAVAVLAVVPLAVGAWATGAERLPRDVASRYWFAAAAVGIGGFALSFLMFNRAILTTSASAAAVILSLIPAFGLLSAVLWLGDPLTRPRVVGVSLIGLSVATFAFVELSAGVDFRSGLDVASGGDYTAGADRPGFGSTEVNGPHRSDPTEAG